MAGKYEIHDSSSCVEGETPEKRKISGLSDNQSLCLQPFSENSSSKPDTIFRKVS